MSRRSFRLHCRRQALHDPLNHGFVQPAHTAVGERRSIDDQPAYSYVEIGRSKRSRDGTSNATCPAIRTHARPPGGVKLRSNFANSARAAAIRWC